MNYVTKKHLTTGGETLVQATTQPNTGMYIGGLFSGFRDPMLVASVDGVGTKLEIAQALRCHHGVGIDLVAMCVNDLVVEKAEPLFFLDYFATGELDDDAIAVVAEGITEGCIAAGCALIGRKTAQMPGFYPKGRYDLAGFAVGVVERERMSEPNAQPGDIVLGLASDGLHANGFSLVRRIVEDDALNLTDRSPFSEGTLGEAFLRPTRIYVHSVLGAIATGSIRSLAHITGGGLVENPPRSLPGGLSMRIDCTAWPLPPVFAWFVGRVAPEELARTFNCGIGMTIVVSPDQVDVLMAYFEAVGETVFRIGEVVEGEGVMLDGLERWW